MRRLLLIRKQSPEHNELETGSPVVLRWGLDIREQNNFPNLFFNQ